MASADDRGYVNPGTAGLLDLLMTSSAAAAESNFLSRTHLLLEVAIKCRPEEAVVKATEGITDLSQPSAEQA